MHHAADVQQGDAIHLSAAEFVGSAITILFVFVRYGINPNVAGFRRGNNEHVQTAERKRRQQRRPRRSSQKYAPADLAAFRLIPVDHRDYPTYSSASRWVPYVSFNRAF